MLIAKLIILSSIPFHFLNYKEIATRDNSESDICALSRNLYSRISGLLTAILKGKDKLNRNVDERKGAGSASIMLPAPEF